MEDIEYCYEVSLIDHEMTEKHKGDDHFMMRDSYHTKQRFVTSYNVVSLVDKLDSLGIGKDILSIHRVGEALEI